jgi:hypothetical protein
MAKGLDAERRKLATAKVKKPKSQVDEDYDNSPKGKARRERAATKRRENSPPARVSTQTTLTTEQLRNQYKGTLRQVQGVLKKQGILASIKELDPVDSKGDSLWTDKQFRSTFYQWRLRNPNASVTDFTFQHNVPQSKINSIERALYAQHPKRLIGMTGPNTYDESGTKIITGNYGLKDRTNMESLSKTGVRSETGVRAGAPIRVGLPAVLTDPRVTGKITSIIGNELIGDGYKEGQYGLGPDLIKKYAEYLKIRALGF